MVQVFLSAGEDENIRNKVVSVLGRVMANNSIQAEKVFTFMDQTAPFDEVSHNKALELVNQFPNEYFGAEM